MDVALTLDAAALSNPLASPFAPAAPPAVADTVLPAAALEAALPGQVTLSHGLSSAAFVSLPQIDVSLLPISHSDLQTLVHAQQRRRALLGERLFQVGIGILMLLSGGACMYRLLWMGW